MNVDTTLANRGRALAVVGGFVGLAGSLAYFAADNLTVGALGLPLSVVGFVLGLAALVFRRRAIILGTVALVMSSPTLAYVAIALALGIRC